MTALIIGLLVGGLLLLVAEIFLPGGIIGLIGGGVLVVGVALSYLEFGAAKGTGILVGTGAAVFVLLYVGLRILPETRMGRKILLSATVEGKTRDPAVEQERSRLVGREGTAQTDLRPAGRGRIDGKRWDIVTDGSYIDKDESFRVVRVEGTRIVVSQVGRAPEDHV